VRLWNKTTTCLASNRLEQEEADLKILHVVRYFTWPYGGPVRSVYDRANSLASRNHEVTIYTTDVGPVHRLDERDKIRSDRDVHIRYFRCLNNWTANASQFTFSPEMQSAFAAEIENFDIIHTHETRGFPNLCVWHFARKHSIPYVLEARGTLPTALPQQKKMYVLAKYLSDRIIYRRIVKDASKVIALTQSESLSYEKLGVEKRNIEVIPNAIDQAYFEKLPARGEFRQRYGIEHEEKIILFLGRIHETKGLERLLRAFYGLNKEVNDVRLVIAGPDGGYLTRLRENIRHLGITDHVLLTGPLYDNAKLEAYVDADVYVQPSFYDAYPLSPLEACACGTPTIVTNRCGVAERIKDVAYVVDYDADQLRSAMRNLVNSAGLRSEMGRRSLTKVREQYNAERIVDDLEKLYQACL
jgi:glycosyltransferase involved in cell wall biosynthesis